MLNFENKKMKISSKALIAELEEMTSDHIERLNSIKQLSIEQLNFKTDPESWSVLECVEHLNRYAEFYIPEIKSRLSKGYKASNNTFKTGMLGNYFTQSMKPKEKLKKIKTFKSMNPINSNVELGSLEKFITFQNDLLGILEKSKSVDLKKVKTSISISKIIKLRLGDTLSFYVYHIERHLQQAERALKGYDSIKEKTQQ